MPGLFDRVQICDRIFANRGVASFQHSLRSVLLHWLVIIVIALIVTKVMWTPAMLLGHSAWYDLTRMVEFNAAMRAGDYFPLWSPDFYYGHGSPVFQFYAPLVYFVTEIPVLAGMDIPSAVKLVEVVALIGSGGAMYHLAARHVSRCAACFGAALYMVAPYRLLDLYVRHAFAEHVAFVWLPAIIWATERFVATRSRASLVMGAVAVAGLILTHNIMALIGLPICVAAGWLLAGRTANWTMPLRAGCPTALGSGLAAFFWWPAFAGRNFIQAEENLTSGHFNYRSNFLEASRFVNFGWGTADTRQVAEMSLQIGLLHFLLGVVALALLLRKKCRNRWSVASGVILIAALFMCHAASEPVWAALPLLKYVQFPWRFLGPAILGAAMCGAVVFDRSKAIFPQMGPLLLGIGLAVLLVAYYPFYATAYFLAGDSRTNTLVGGTPAQVKAMRANGTLCSVDRIVTPDRMRTIGEHATSADDFLPKDVAEKPTAPPPDAVSTESGEVAQSTRAAFNSYRAKVSMRTAGIVELHQFWFPGWAARVDGRTSEAVAQGKTGIVSCHVPAGEHLVEFEYNGLPQRRAGLVVSMVSVALAAIALNLLSKRQPEVKMADE